MSILAEEMSSMYHLHLFRDLSILKAILVAAAFLSILLCLYRVLRSYLRLSHVPGPLLASLSNVSRVSWALSGRAHNKHIDLHQRYGDLVRFGPNMISVGDPGEIPTLYPLKSGFIKVRIIERANACLTARSQAY